MQHLVEVGTVSLLRGPDVAQAPTQGTTSHHLLACMAVQTFSVQSQQQAQQHLAGCVPVDNTSAELQVRICAVT